MSKIMNKIIRTVSALLAVCVLSSAPMSVSAMEVDYETVAIAGGFIRVNRYTGVLQGSTQNLTGALVIPEEAGGVKITSIADSAFYGREGLTSVTIPGTVKSIGDQVFTSCLSLKSVKIGEGVTSMGKDVFRYCYSLTDVSLPSTLTAILDYSFYKCIALESIRIPNGVSSIGSYVFADSTKLKTVSLPNSVKSIGDYCFSGCTAISGVNLPTSLTNVPTALFSGCSSLEKIVVPTGVQSVSGLAFRGCSGLRTISLPASVTSVRASAFDGCSNVTFYVEDGSYSHAFAVANKIPCVVGTLENNTPDTPAEDDLGSYAATPFTDDKSHWARKYIEWAYAKGYFNGVTPTTFMPDASVKRGMIVTVLYRMDGTPPTVGTANFTDVSPKDYYAAAISWAESNGIVDGVGNGKFAPENDITREQLATILYRYAKYKNMDISARGDLSRFKDNTSISSYAGTAVSWAVGSKIINGMTPATLEPLGTATRAQTTVMLKNFDNLQ